MAFRSNKEVFRWVIVEGFNLGNVDELDERYSPAWRGHQFDLPATPDEFKA